MNMYAFKTGLVVDRAWDIDPALLELLEQAFGLAQERLRVFAHDADFGQKMALAFGDRVNLGNLQAQWQVGDFGGFPAIEVRSRTELNGAYGAFAVGTGKIYLAQELLENQSLDQMVAALLEEYGHFVDTHLNIQDTLGDEGEIFAALVQGKTLSENDLQTIRAENDWTSINLDGKAIEVEQITFTDIDIAARGLGNDFINTTSGRNYRVIGTSANNTILVNSGSDLVYGRGGNDTIAGGLNDDELYGGDGNDIVTGNDGNDVLDGGGGQDTLAGGRGNDIYRVSLGSNSVGIVINDLGNHSNPLGNVAGGGSDTLLIYQEAFQESPEDELYQAKEVYQTVVAIIDNRLKNGVVGSQRDGTALMIDLNKDGMIDKAQDLSILNFYNPDGSPGAGYIENIVGKTFPLSIVDPIRQGNYSATRYAESQIEKFIKKLEDPNLTSAQIKNYLGGTVPNGIIDTNGRLTEQGKNRLRVTLAQKGCYLSSLAMAVNVLVPGVNQDTATLYNQLPEDSITDIDKVAKWSSTGVPSFKGADPINNDIEEVLNSIDSSLDLRPTNSTLEIYTSIAFFGKPVLLNVKNGGHWVLAKGVKIENGQTLFDIVDPGSTSGGFNGFKTLAAMNFKTAKILEGNQTSSLTIQGHSPIDILITDSTGKKIGYDPIANTEYSEISNSSYTLEYPIIDPDDEYTPEELVTYRSSASPLAFIDSIIPGTYTVKVFGVADGEYQVDFNSDNGASNIPSVSFGGYITKNQTINYQVTVDSSLRPSVKTVNNKPVVATDTTITILEDSSSTLLNITTPTDPDGDTLAITISNLPDPIKGKVQLANGTDLTANQTLTISDLIGLNFVSASNVNGTAGNFSYTVSDGKGGTASQTINLEILSVNDPPILQLATPNQAALPNMPFSLTFAANTFTDIDENDSLSYSLTLENGSNLPSWLTFNPATRTLGGTAQSSDVGLLNLNLIATDRQGATANDSFTLEITAINQVPGTPNNDTLIGSNSSDLLDGQNGRDILIGGLGNDILIGGFGSDTLTAGAGRDYFVYNDITDRTDRITDFTVGEDLLDLRGLFGGIGYKGSDPIADGYLQIAPSGSGSSIRIDVDGPFGSSIFKTLTTLDTVLPSALTPNQYLI